MSKLYIVTGTSSGIGKALAEQLSEKSDVIGISRNQAPENEHYKHLDWDLSKISDKRADQLYEFSKKYEGVFLINNAGTIGNIKPASQLSLQDLDYTHRLNYIAPAFLMNFLHKKLGNKLKVVLNIGSGAAQNAIDAWSTYCSSKAALLMYARCFAEELQKRDFTTRIFDVSPGVVNTSMQKKIRSANPEEFLESEKFHKLFKNNELNDPKIVAGKIIYIIKNRKDFSKTQLSLRELDIS